MNIFKKEKKRIYLDYAAATPVDVRVMTAMKRYWSQNFYNPSSLYREGVHAKQELEKFRKNIADLFSVRPSEIIFTHGGTESNNLAIQGVVHAFQKENPKIVPHVVVSAVEHDAVYECAKKLEQKGNIELTVLPVNEDGIIDIKNLKESLKENTVLVSIMYVNNEIGVVQPIREITKTVRWFKKQQGNSAQYPLVHTDAIQATQFFDMHIPRLGVDLMTVSAAKIYGPKGIAFLFAKSNTLLEPLLYGGGQELGIRSGTENVPLVAGFVRALNITFNEREKEFQRMLELQSYFLEKLAPLEAQYHFFYNGSFEERSPNNISISVPFVSGEQLVIELDARGIICSARSACSSGEGVSHVMKALHPDQHKEIGSLRFSIGRSTTKKDIDDTVTQFEKVLKKVLSTQERFFSKN